MIRAAAMAALMLSGCAAFAQTPDAQIKRVEREDMTFGDGVTVIRDESRAVTCWVFWGSQKGGISCLPDWMFVERAAEPKTCGTSTTGYSLPCDGPARGAR